MTEVLVPQQSIIDPSYSPGSQGSYVLIIQISYLSFTYCILEPHSNTILALEDFNVPGSMQSKDNLFSYIEKLPAHFIAPDNINTFKSIRVLVENMPATLVPGPLLDEEQLHTYLDFNITLKKDDHLQADKLNNMGGSCIFAMHRELHQALNSYFIRPQIFHHTSSLIEGLLIRFKNMNLDNKIFVNVRQNFQDIIIFRDGKLRFFNTFEYLTQEDFLYFLLFVSDKFDLNPEQFELILSGRITERSEIYNFLYKYIRNISFLGDSTGINLSPAFSKVRLHTYFSLINHYLCAS